MVVVGGGAGLWDWSNHHHNAPQATALHTPPVTHTHTLPCVTQPPGKAKVEPYAYWSLDRRRGKQAAADKLASVVGGAQAGALKGAKAKRAGVGRAAGGGPAAADGARGGKGPAKRQRMEE